MGQVRVNLPCLTGVLLISFKFKQVNKIRFNFNRFRQCHIELFYEKRKRKKKKMQLYSLGWPFVIQNLNSAAIEGPLKCCSGVICAPFFLFLSSHKHPTSSHSKVVIKSLLCLHQKIKIKNKKSFLCVKEYITLIPTMALSSL